MVRKIRKYDLIKPVTEKPLYQMQTDSKRIEQFSSTSTVVQQVLRYFCQDTTDKIIKNMYEMGVNTEKREVNGVKFTGNLRRSIHWTIVNNAGGDGALINFYYLKYADFLEMSASGWLLRKFGSVHAGMVPEMTDISPIKFGGRPWGAKPFLHSELRRKSKKLTNRLARHFAFMGGMMIFKSFVHDDELPDSIINKFKTYTNEV